MKTLAKQMEALQGRLDIQVKTNDMLLDRLRLQTKIIDAQDELINKLNDFNIASQQDKIRNYKTQEIRLKIAELKNELEK